MAHKSVSIKVGNRDLVIETGKVAKQAARHRLVRYGDTVVLVTVVQRPREEEGLDFFPLTVDYQEKMYAAGQDPGRLLQARGTRPPRRRRLTCRVIDRSLRPLFAEGFQNETQVIATVLSIDKENDGRRAGAHRRLGGAARSPTSPSAAPSPASASAAWTASSSPTPPLAERAECDLDVVVAASRDAIVMVEGGAKEVLRGGHGGRAAVRPRGRAAACSTRRRSSASSSTASPSASSTRPCHDAELKAKVTRARLGRASSKAYEDRTTSMDRYAALSKVKKEVPGSLAER